MTRAYFKKQYIQLAAWMLLVSGILVYTGCSKDDSEEDNTPVPTCSDGIQNQGETGVDCGGPCSSCPMSARDSVVNDYNTNYLGSAVSDPGWTGDDGLCLAGSVSSSTDSAVIRRINYFRRLVGLNGNTVLDVTQFQKFREAALMMKANNTLSHNPPTTWLCYTSLGASGAAASNLAYGQHSSSAVTGFIQDAGTGNTSVGHRRWILHSPKTKFSYGTTDFTMSLGVIGVAGGNTQIPEFIAYPKKGYMPQGLVFPRWSFGIPGADFSSATVTMTGPSGNVPLTIVSSSVTGVGDNTIVWEPTGVNTTGTTDVTYSVTVNNISNAPNSSYTYNVIIIRP